MLTFFKTCLPELLKSNGACSSNSWQHTGSFYETPCSLSVLSVTLAVAERCLAFLFLHLNLYILDSRPPSGLTPQTPQLKTPKDCRTANTHTHTPHPFNGPLSGTTRVSRYQKGKTNLDFTGARDSEWQWHQLGHMQVCTLLQSDNHASTPPLSFLQAGCPTNSVKALKAELQTLSENESKSALYCASVPVV